MAETPEKAPAPAKKKGGLIVLILVAALAGASGFAVPRFLAEDTPKKHAPVHDAKKPAVVPFGDVVVNLGGEDRLNRYLRLKVLLVVDGNQEKAINEQLNKQKPHLKNWLIGYLSDLSLQEVGRAAGVNRLRREIRDQFNAMLWPDGQELISEILFDEFVVQ